MNARKSHKVWVAIDVRKLELPPFFGRLAC